MAARVKKGGGLGTGSQAGSQSSAGKSSYMTSQSQAVGTLGEISYRLTQLREALFGVALIAVKDTDRALRWRLFDLVVQTICILLVPLSLCEWGRHWGGPWTPVADYLHGYIRFDLWSYSNFLAVWAAAVAFVGLAALDVVYVGWAFSQHKFTLKFPLRYLRIFGHTLPTAGFVPIILVLLEIWDCPPMHGGAAPHISFPRDLKCYSGTHMILLAITTIAIAAYLLLCFGFAMFFYETDPRRANTFMARPHARSELAMLLTLTGSCIALGISSIPDEIEGLLTLGLGLFSLYNVFAYYAFYRHWMNLLRAACFAFYSWVGLFIFVEARYGEALEGSSWASPAAFYALMLVGALASGGAAWYAADWNFRRYHCSGGAFKLRLTRPWHIELGTRFLHTDRSKAAIEVADVIFKRGLELFPFSAAVRVAYGQFRLETDDSPQIGYRYFQDAQKCDPFLDIGFRVWKAEHERTSMMQASGLGSTQSTGKVRPREEADALIGLLEFQRDMEGARKYHRACVRAFKKFWSLVIAEDVTLAKLEAAVSSIDHNETRAQGHYKSLVARHPNNPRILRSYAKFHEEVLNDPAAAQDLYDAADEFEEVGAAAQKRDAAGLDAAVSEDGEDGPEGGADGGASARGGPSEQGPSARSGNALGLDSVHSGNNYAAGLSAVAESEANAVGSSMRSASNANNSRGRRVFVGGIQGPGAQPRSPLLGGAGGGFADMAGQVAAGLGGILFPPPPPPILDPAPLPEAALAPAPAPAAAPEQRRESLLVERRESMTMVERRTSVASGHRSSVSGVAAWLAQSHSTAVAGPEGRPPAAAAASRSRAGSVKMERETVLVVGPQLAIRSADEGFALVFGVPPERAAGRPLGDFLAGLHTEPDVQREKAAGGNLLAAALGLEAALGQTRCAGEALGPLGERWPVQLALGPAEAGHSPSAAAYRLTVRRTEAAPPPPAPAPAPAAPQAPSAAASPPLGPVAAPAARAAGLVRSRSKATSFRLPAAETALAPASARGQGSARDKAKPLNFEAPPPAIAVHGLDGPTPEDSGRRGGADPDHEELARGLAPKIASLAGSAGTGNKRRASIAEGAQRASVAEFERASHEDEDENGSDGRGGQSKTSTVLRQKSIKRINRLKRRLALSGGSDAGIARMRRTVLFVVVVLIALAVAFYFTVENLVGVYDRGITRVGESSRRALEACSAPIYGRMMALAGLPGWEDPDGALEAHAREELKSYLDGLEQYHLDLKDIAADNAVAVTRVVTDGGRTEEAVGRLWDLGFEMIDSGRELLKFKSGEELRRAYPDPLDNPRFKFLVDNGPESVFRAFVASAQREDSAAYASFASIRAFVDVMVAAATVLCLVLAVFFFRPTINAVRREKEAALRIFFDIPKSTVQTIASGSKQQGMDDLDDDDDLNFEDDEDFAADTAGAKKGKGADQDDNDDAASVGAATHAAKEELRKGRRLKRVFEGRGRGVDGMTVRYTAAFLVLFLAFFLWFLVSYLDSASCEYFTSERRAAGLRRAERNQVLYFAQELVTDATGTFGAKYATGENVEETLAGLRKAIAALEGAHRDLLYGSGAGHLPGSVKRYAAQDRLLFGVDCLREPAVCLEERAREGHRYYNGMHRLLSLFLQHAKMLAASPRELLVPSNKHYQFLVWAAEGPLDEEMKASIELYVEEAHVVLGRFMATQKLLVAAVVIAVLACYFLVFRGIISSVSDDSRRTLFILLIIPAEVIDSVESIRAHLIRKAAAGANAAAAAGPA